jgi:phosphoribosylanthranilate isomerase
MDDFFQIKVCGVKRAQDLAFVHDAGADAIGINLVPESPRCVDLTVARRLRDEANRLGLRVAIVMMNAETSAMEKAVAVIQPDILQLHGDELPSALPDAAGGLSIVKSLSWTGRKPEELLAKRWLEEHSHRLAFLVDAYAPGIGGGTGKLARWDLLRPRPRMLSAVPLLLAGGLKPENVAAGILATHCSGVDTASGVEVSPGVKDANLVLKFVTAAKRAFNQEAE